MMNEAKITQYVIDTFEGVHAVEVWGDSFFFYNPGRSGPDEIYFATLKRKDDEYDNRSNLNRPGVFRLNIGISKATYRALFGASPSRHGTKGGMARDDDYTALNQLLPHPVYGHLYWVCVLNPSAATFEAVQPLLREAYDVAVSKYMKRMARDKAAQD